MPHDKPILSRKNPFFPENKNITCMGESKGQYTVICTKHNTSEAASSLLAARRLMRYPKFCPECMKVAEELLQLLDTLMRQRR